MERPGRAAGFVLGVDRLEALQPTPTEALYLMVEQAVELRAGIDAELELELELIKAERQADGIDYSSHEEPYEERLAQLMPNQ